MKAPTATPSEAKEGTAQTAQLLERLSEGDADAPWTDLKSYRCRGCSFQCINRLGQEWTQDEWCRSCWFRKNVLEAGHGF